MKLLVEEHYGKWKVSSNYNGNLIQNFLDRESAIEFAQDYAYHQGMDGVIVHLPPEKSE